MSILDTELDITVKQLDKAELLRLIKMSNISIKDHIEMSNILYQEPNKLIRNKYNYILEVAHFYDSYYYYVGWNLSKNKKFKNHSIYQVDIDCGDVRLADFEARDYTFDNFEEKFQAVLKEYNIAL